MISRRQIIESQQELSQNNIRPPINNTTSSPDNSRSKQQQQQQQARETPLRTNRYQSSANYDIRQRISRASKANKMIPKSSARLQYIQQQQQQKFQSSKNKNQFPQAEDFFQDDDKIRPTSCSSSKMSNSKRRQFNSIQDEDDDDFDFDFDFDTQKQNHHQEEDEEDEEEFEQEDNRYRHFDPYSVYGEEDEEEDVWYSEERLFEVRSINLFFCIRISYLAKIISLVIFSTKLHYCDSLMNNNNSLSLSLSLVEQIIIHLMSNNLNGSPLALALELLPLSQSFLFGVTNVKQIFLKMYFIHT